jgi:trk system potassium uptake protein TrkA
MRIVFLGAGNLTVMTARRLLEQGHDVVIIEKLKSRIDELTEQLDCGFLHGDGSKPAVLREAGPENTDILFCLTGNDQVNILASLVGRSMGFSRVVTKVEDPELEHICTELNLEDIIVPTRTISHYLADMVAGRDILELSSIIKHQARVISFIVQEGKSYTAKELDLPSHTAIICYYRENEFFLPKEDTVYEEGDEVVLITDNERLQELKELFIPQTAEEEAGAQGKEEEKKGEQENSTGKK